MTHIRFTNSPRRTARRSRRARAEDGQALVELALVLPLLLLLVFGITQFSLALNSANNETHVASEIARYAAVNDNPSCETGSVCSAGLAAWGKRQVGKVLENETVCITFPLNPVTNTAGQQGDPVEVAVTGRVNWIPFFKYKKFPSTLVAGKAIMRLEHAPTTYGKECA
jgi:Flp pilus assembly protein TadG